MADHLRRVLGVVLAATVLLVAPQVAHATFGSSASRSMQVGTASLTQPTGTVAANCTYGFLSSGARPTVTVGDGNNFDEVVFDYRLYRGNSAQPVATSLDSSARSATLTAPNVFLGSTSYRITVEARLGGWTSQTATTTFSC